VLHLYLVLGLGNILSIYVQGFLVKPEILCAEGADCCRRAL